MSAGFDTLAYEERDGVAWLTLSRPEVLNALNLQMRDELWAALDGVEANPDVAVVVFRGAGERAFSAGADISEFGTAPSPVEARRARIERDLWGRLLHFEKPLIAAVHGYALGAGCELSLLCDLRIAADDALFGVPETRLGYIPTAGGTQTLPRTVGQGPALDMLLTAEPITASQALDWGLVHEVVPRAELDARVALLAQRLRELPAESLQAERRLLRAAPELSLQAALRLEAQARVK